MKFKRLLSPRNLGLLASIAVIGIAAGGYLIIDGRPAGYSCANGGTVAATPAGNCVTSAATYSRLTIVTLKATPKPGFHFVHWTGSSTSATAAIKVIMSAARSVTAVFAAGAVAKGPEAAAEPTSAVN